MDEDHVMQLNIDAVSILFFRASATTYGVLLSVSQADADKIPGSVDVASARRRSVLHQSLRLAGWSGRQEQRSVTLVERQ